MDPEMIYLGFTLTSTTARLNVFDQSLAQVKSNYNIATRDIQSLLGNTMSAESGRQSPCCDQKIQLPLTKLIDNHDLLPVIHGNIAFHPVSHKHITTNIRQFQFLDELLHRTGSISLPDKHNPRSLWGSVDLIQQLNQLEDFW